MTNWTNASAFVRDIVEGAVASHGLAGLAGM